MNDPLSPSLNESSRAPMKCCVQLCCKTMYYRPDERPGKLHYSDTQMYWCSRTQDPQGPDGGDTSPLVCQPDRSCFCQET